MSKLVWAVASALALAACGGSGNRSVSESDRAKQVDLQYQADAKLNAMQNRDPALRGVLDGADAYAVFPEIGKAGLGVGGAYGRGVLYEHGMSVGEVTLKQVSVGAQAGGETYAELLVLKDPEQVQKLKAGNFSLGADASAIAITEGSAAEASFKNGQAVFVMPKQGLMAEVSLEGQTIGYQPFAG